MGDSGNKQMNKHVVRIVLDDDKCSEEKNPGRYDRITRGGLAGKAASGLRREKAAARRAEKWSSSREECESPAVGTGDALASNGQQSGE